MIAAAHTVLVDYFPSQQAVLDADYEAAIAGVPVDLSRRIGVTIGRRYGTAVVKERRRRPQRPTPTEPGTRARRVDSHAAEHGGRVVVAQVCTTVRPLASAHGCATAAMFIVLAKLLSASPALDIDIDIVTTGTTRHFATVADLLDEVGNARVWGGIHWRFSVVAGVRIGRSVAGEVLRHGANLG